MQELCARHASRFAPLGITLEPWVNLLKGRVMKFPGLLLAYTPANAPAVVVTAGAVQAAGPAVGTVVAPAATAPAVGTVVSPAAGPPVPTTVAPSPYNSSYPPTAGGVVQGHVTQPYGAASTSAVVQGYATPPPQAAQAVGTTVAPPPYTPPQAVQAEVVAAAPMDRK